MNREDVIKEFHRMWDTFPGIARLITDKHEIIAANETARKAGFTEGAFCARVGTPESHRNCLLGKMFRTGETQLQRFGEDRIKGWMPVDGFQDLCIHFAVVIPEEKQ